MESEPPLIGVATLHAKGILLVEDGNHGEYRPRRDEFVADGVAFIRAADLTDGSVDFENADKINDTALARIRKGVGRQGDLLLTHKGTVGRVARVPEDAPPFVCSPQTTAWRVLDARSLDPSFLYAYMRSPAFARQLSQRAHETDMAPYVSLTAQRSLVVPVRPIEDQRRIGRTAQAFDDKVDGNRRLAALLEQTAEAKFLARFVDLVPRPSEIGPAEQRNRPARLSDIAALVKETVQPAETSDQPFEHFSIPAFDAGNGPELVTGSTILSAKTRVPSNDCVLLSKLNPATKRVWWPSPRHRGEPVCSSEFLVLQPKPDVPNSYLYATLSVDERFYGELLGRVSGTTGSRQRVRAEDVLNCRVVLPSRYALQGWDRFADPIYELARRLRAHTEILAAVRDALLPKLVSGQIRVTDTADPEEIIGPVAEEAVA